jgi:hypothetical protein
MMIAKKGTAKNGDCHPFLYPKRVAVPTFRHQSSIFHHLREKWGLQPFCTQKGGCTHFSPPIIDFSPPPLYPLFATKTNHRLFGVRLV